MKLWSDSWPNGEAIPARYACGRLDGASGVAFSDNVSPHLAWSELPAATRSLVLICHDFDVPSRGDDVNQAGREIPADLPRIDFFHWLLADIPVTTTRDRRGRLQPRLHAARQAGPGGVGAGLRRRAPRTERLHRLVRRRSEAGRRLLRLRRAVPALERLARPPLPVHALRARRSRARRSMAASTAPSCARRSTATSSPRRCTREPIRSIAGCSAREPHDGRAGGRGDADRRRAPRRDGLERRDADAGPARHGPQRARPLAGGARRRGAGRRGHRGDRRQRPGARLRHRRSDRCRPRPADHDRCRPARALLRRVRGPHLRRDRRSLARPGGALAPPRAGIRP